MGSIRGLQLERQVQLLELNGAVKGFLRSEAATWALNDLVSSDFHGSKGPLKGWNGDPSGARRSTKDGTMEAKRLFHRKYAAGRLKRRGTGEIVIGVAREHVAKDTARGALRQNQGRNVQKESGTQSCNHVDPTRPTRQLRRYTGSRKFSWVSLRACPSD